MKKVFPVSVKLSFPRDNNFEWLRLIFATQVVIVHGAEHLGFKFPHFIMFFPGVPAFFFVSGFLIYASYLNTPGKRYFSNRFLRLFPALFFVTIGGVGVALFAHGPKDFITHFSTYAIWIISQLTLGQTYNPSYFRDIGVGVMNGSLWTITTEIVFYLCVPIIVAIERRFKYALWLLITSSLLIYAFGPRLWPEPIYRNKTFYDILALTPIVWGWMFGFGILAVKHFESYSPNIKYFIIALPIMLIMSAFGHTNFFLGSSGNRLGLLYFICYTLMILWLAFGIKTIKLPFDISYGVYIWHMPIINFLIVISVKALWLAVLLSFCFAAISWIFIEKPALRLKKHSLKPVT
jgi:peptidoglycan/LPS O-acetylase OafA/YrhL